MEHSIADYDLSQDQIKRALKDFDVPNHELNSMMLRVMQLVTTKEFYEDKEEVSSIPDYGFRIHDIIQALDMAENTRESVRKDVLKRLRPKGVLGYTEPAPNSPNTHYYLSQEFREYLDNTELEEVISEPDQGEGENRTVDLDYHDEVLNRAPGDHSKLIADGLEKLITKLAEEPKLVQEGLDKTEREDVKNKVMPIEFAGYKFKLPVYPDAIVYDSSEKTLYLLEAVTNLGPFSDRRINKIIEALKKGKPIEEEDGLELDLVFITMFPDERRYRNHLMDLGDRSYVWLADHKETLRAHGKVKTNSFNSSNSKHAFSYSLNL